MLRAAYHAWDHMDMCAHKIKLSNISITNNFNIRAWAEIILNYLLYLHFQLWHFNSNIIFHHVSYFCYLGGNLILILE